ncbi:MAG TPA: hypothetical protein VLE74_02530, partial [Candidatus Saccharimonadales bacterium]|nr:hypothetical protein [Candidatus Saccharimonadales bacterium]
MARRKKSLRLTRKQRKQALAFALPVAIGLGGLIAGIIATRVLSGRKPPANLVWGADSSIRVPKELQAYLQTRRDCKEYRGAGSPTGVGLWGVYQLSQGKFAKIAYGCSWNLSSYVMAVRYKGA